MFEIVDPEPKELLIFHWIRSSTNCRKPTVNPLNFAECLNYQKDVKNHCDLPCAKRPLPNFPNLRRNTCRYF